MDLFFQNQRKSLKQRLAVCFFAIFNFLAAPPASMAVKKIDAVLHTQESMHEHGSDEPRRLMCDVLLEQFAKGNVVQVVNRENSRTLTKYHDPNYHVGANLIAFNASPEIPVRVSISIQLVKRSTGKVILTSDQAVSIDARIIESALKIHRPEFDNSEYGKAITLLSRMSAKLFEEKLAQMKIE